MMYPKISLIIGTDLNDIINTLKNVNIDYKILPSNNGPKIDKTMIMVSCDKQKRHFSFELLKEGLFMPFFNSTKVPLSWNIKEIYPKFWTINTNNIEIKQSDELFWNLTATSHEKLLMTNIINYCIEQENEAIDMYEKILLPICLHPDIQYFLDLLNGRKTQHVNMWTTIKEKFAIVIDPKMKPIRIHPKTLVYIVDVIVKLIDIEKNPFFFVKDNLQYFLNQGYFETIETFLNFRNLESLENSKLLTSLLTAIEKMYPFLDDEIKIRLK